MSSSAPVSRLRGILEGHLSQLSRELERALEARLDQVSAEVGARARTECADRLNEAARRMRAAPGRVELASALVDGAAAFATGVALLSITETAARGELIRGAPRQQAERFRDLEIPLTSAAAVGEAVTSRDPVATIASPAEISPQLAALGGEGRAFLYPIVTAGRVPALLYAWGAVQGSALELLTQVAAALWASAPAGTVSIGPAPARPSAWESLTAEEQRVHLRAQRFARVQAAELRLLETERVQSGRTRRDLYGALRPRIDAARESFRSTFFAGCPSMVDYLHLELVHTLAYDDAEALGKDYPGPLL